MPFVNEFIPEADQAKYKSIEDTVFDRTGCVGMSPARQWTIDRERDIFLTRIKGGGADIDRRHFEAFIFYWSGRIIYIETWFLNTEGGDGQLRITTSRIDLISELDKHQQFQKFDMQTDREQKLAMLTEVFTAKRGSGVFNREQCEYKAVLQLAEGV